MTPPEDDSIVEMYNANAQAMLLYARQWVEAAEAEDVVQRVFVRMLSGGSLPAEPRTWLFRCVRNEAISMWRSGWRRERREQAAARDAAGWFVPRNGDLIDAALAQQATEALPPDQREVVTLRIWSGLTLTEIAGVTGLAVSTAHHHYHAAMAALRERLEPSCKNRNL